MLDNGNTFPLGPFRVRRNPNHMGVGGILHSSVQVMHGAEKRALMLDWRSQKDLLREEACRGPTASSTPPVITPERLAASQARPTLLTKPQWTSRLKNPNSSNGN